MDDLQRFIHQIAEGHILCGVDEAPNTREFEHIFDARTLIEPLIARTAAARRTAVDIAIMEAAVQSYIGAANRDASRLADTALHLAIAEATHNPVLVGISTDLRAKITLNLGAEPYSDEARRTAIGRTNSGCRMRVWREPRAACSLRQRVGF